MWILYLVFFRECKTGIFTNDWTRFGWSSWFQYGASGRVHTVLTDGIETRNLGVGFSQILKKKIKEVEIISGLKKNLKFYTLFLLIVQMRLSSWRMITSGWRGSNVMCLTAEDRLSHWVGRFSDNFLEKGV